MKKYVALLLVIVMLLFAACGQAQSPNGGETTPTTTVTEPSGTDELTNPSDPSDTNPSESSEEATQPSTDTPTEPSDPTVEPSEPTTGEPSDPTEPTIKPTEPTKPTQPSEPTTKPTAPGGNSSTGSTEQPTQPSEPTTKPSEPTGGNNNTDNTEKPTQPSEPSEPNDEIVVPPDDYTLKVSPTTLTLEVGNTQTLKVEYGGKGTLSWNSSNTDVATVSSKGKVTAKAAGTAVITVTDGVKKSQCAVTVKAAAVAASLTINTPKNTTIFVGETLKLDYTYTGTDKVTFESWDTSILTIDSNGKMKGVSEGVVGVQVTAGKLYKFVDIVVKSKANVATSIRMTEMEGPLFDGVTKHVGNYMSFVAKSRPTGTLYGVNVESTNSGVVAVSAKTINGDETQITLKFKAAGSATITLTSEDGNVVYKYKVNVKSEYSCYPGKEKLTPEEFANACTQVMVENGFTYSTGCTSYRVLTLNADKLTWTNARSFAQGYVRSWYPNGCNKCWISYEGTDENGNYVFYTRWA